MPKKNLLLIPVLLIFVLSSCAGQAEVNTPDPKVSESSTSDTPDVLVPIDAAVESVIEQDVSATKQQVDTYVLTTPGVSVVPENLIVNSQSRIADIVVVINDDRTYTIKGSAKNSDFMYELSGQIL